MNGRNYKRCLIPCCNESIIKLLNRLIFRTFKTLEAPTVALYLTTENFNRRR